MQTPIIPTYPLPKGYTSSGQLLINRVLAGANIRYKETFTPAVTTRIKEELRVIRRTHTCDYFLLWSDIAKFCKEYDILTTPGRGSAANSIVNYCLGITHVDPMKVNPVAPMLFSRFFNENLSLPRIDMDVEPDAVDQVYAFIDELIGHTYTTVQIKGLSQGVKHPYDCIVSNESKCASKSSIHSTNGRYSRGVIMGICR